MASVERATASVLFQGASTTDITHTIPSGVNCLAVVVPYGKYIPNNYGPPGSVTWDQGGVNEALTYIGIVEFGGWGAVELWLKWNPTSGTSKTLRISWPNPPSQELFVAFNLQDVDQTATGTPAVLSNIGTGTPAGDKTVTFSGFVSGDVVVGGWFDDQGIGSTLTVLNSPVAGALYHDLFEDSDGAAHAWYGGTVGYNLTDAANGDWSLGAWLFKGYAANGPHTRQYGPRGMLATLVRM
jgi:hypothetical protein